MKKILKKFFYHPWLINILFFNRFSTVFIRGKMNKIIINSSFTSKGKHNIIELAKGGKLYKCKFRMSGDNNRIVIGEETTIVKGHINIEGSNNTVIIGNRTKMCGQINIACIESTRIDIGDDCLFSAGIELRSGDSHSIIDGEGNRLNGSKSITIENHVWVGQNVFILKGVKIPKNSIVGAGSILTKVFTETNVIIAGVPAKIVRSDVNWDANRIPLLKGP